MAAGRTVKARPQLWECTPCRRTVLVLHHTGESLPSERACACGRAMGLVLFTATDDEQRCSPATNPNRETVRA